MRYQCFKYTVENNGSSENAEVQQYVTHCDDVNKDEVARSADDVNIDHLLEVKAARLHDGRGEDPKSEAELRTEFIRLGLLRRSQAILHARDAFGCLLVVHVAEAVPFLFFYLVVCSLLSLFLILLFS